MIAKLINRISGLVNEIETEEERSKIEQVIAEIYHNHMKIYGDIYRDKEDFDSRFNGEILIVDDANIYKYFMDGYYEPATNYEHIGSAGPYIRSILRTFYEEDIELERGKELIIYCILQGIKISRDIGEPIQLGIVKERKATIMPAQEIEEIIHKINGREKILHDIWTLLSKKPEVQQDVENLIKEGLAPD